MGPLSLGIDLASFSSASNPATGFLLWQDGGNYLTIDASGDKFYINLI